MNKETFENKLEKIEDFCEEHFYSLLSGTAAVGYLTICFLTKKHYKQANESLDKALLAQLLMSKCSESK